MLEFCFSILCSKLCTPNVHSWQQHHSHRPLGFSSWPPLRLGHTPLQSPSRWSFALGYTASGPGDWRKEWRFTYFLFMDIQHHVYSVWHWIKTRLKKKKKKPQRYLQITHGEMVILVPVSCSIFFRLRPSFPIRRPTKLLCAKIFRGISSVLYVRENEGRQRDRENP